VNELFWWIMLSSIKYLESTCTYHQTVIIQNKRKHLTIIAQKKRGKEKQKLKKSLLRSYISQLDLMVGGGVTLGR